MSAFQTLHCYLCRRLSVVDPESCVSVLVDPTTGLPGDIGLDDAGRICKRPGPPREQLQARPLCQACAAPMRAEAGLEAVMSTDDGTVGFVVVAPYPDGRQGFRINPRRWLRRK